VRTFIQFLVALLLPALAQAQGATTKPTLLLAASSAKPGDTVLAGVRFQMEEGWHGDSHFNQMGAARWRHCRCHSMADAGKIRHG
jgi:hypothetical protein